MLETCDLRENKSEFEKALIEAIDDGLSALGETVKSTLLFLVREHFHIEKNEMLEKPREFSSALRSILGDHGGRFIENLIVKHLYSKLGLGSPENKGDKEFHEHILEARKKSTLVSRM